MKNLCSIALCAVACFLFCGFQQGSTTNPREGNSKGQAKHRQNADSSGSKHTPPAPDKQIPESADQNPSGGADKSQDQNVKVVSAPEMVIRPVKDHLDLIIVVCTVILTIVGVVGTVVAIWTLRAIKRQAEIMEEHRASLEQLAKAAADNAGAASKNAEFSKLNANATEKSAEAARASADAANASIRLLVSKERARISVDVPNKLELSNDPFNTVKYKVHVFAPTPAIIVDAQARAEVTDSATPDAGRFTLSMSIKSTETRTSSVIEKTALLFAGGDDLVQDINEKRRFIHFYGFIKYRDVFQSQTDEPHETTFGYFWTVGSDVTGILPKIGEGRWESDWEENPPGANKET